MNKKIIVYLILSMFLITTINAIGINEDLKKSDEIKLINPLPFGFNSYIELNYDSSVLEEPIDPRGGVRNVDLNLKFWTDVPKDFLWFIPSFWRNQILFGNQMGTADIYLSLDNIPSWGTFSIAPSRLIMEITDCDNKAERWATIQISLNVNAPAYQTHNLIINTDADKEKFLNPTNEQIEMDITPGWIHYINVEIDNQWIEILSGNSSNITIQITNNGNGLQMIEGIIHNPYNEPPMELSLDPHIIFTHVNESKNMTLEIQTTYQPYINRKYTIEIELYIWNPYTGIKYESYYLTLGIHIHS
ncbi:hypothetical protein ACFL1L_04905 [Thermoplasmatota archaeon]